MQHITSPCNDENRQEDKQPWQAEARLMQELGVQEQPRHAPLGASGAEELCTHNWVTFLILAQAETP